MSATAAAPDPHPSVGVTAAAPDAHPAAAPGRALAPVRSPVLRGPRVVLREPSPDDEVAFLSATHASTELHTPWAAPPADATQYGAFLERSGRPDVTTFLARRTGTDDGALVAVVTLSQIFLGAFRNAYLGYSAFTPHDGMGYTSEAVRLVLAHAFDVLRLHRVEANVQPANLRSLALIRRCGFRREGYSPRYLHLHGAWRDHERWALLEEEWRAAQAPA